MANHKSALKRIRSSEKKRVHNKQYRSQTRTQVKKARLSIEAGSVEAAIAETKAAISQLDKAADKGIIHKNNAARRKSRLMKRLNELQAQQAAQ